MAITLAQAEAQLAAYLAAETAILAGQEYTINGRSLRRADLADVRAGIREWNSMVQSIGTKRSRTVSPGF